MRSFTGNCRSQPGDSREETREGPGVGIALDEAFVVPEPVRRHDVLL